MICIVGGLPACAETLPNIPTEYRTADEWKSAGALPPHGINEQLDSYDENRPAAKCLNGVFVGNMENDVAVWRGIPYAKAPVGDLRFRRAQDPDDSDAICDTTMAMQLESGSEEFRSVFEQYKRALLDLGYPEDAIAREYCNDRSLAIGNTYQAIKHAENGGKGYFYIFEQPYDGSMAKYGAAHAIDCYYLFGTFEGNEAAGTKEEVDLSRKFQRMIANFCCTGDPSTEDTEWPVYTAEDLSTMMIGPNMRVEKDPESARVDAALKMVDLDEDYRYLKSFSSVLSVVQERYPEVFEAYIMNASKAE